MRQGLTIERVVGKTIFLDLCQELVDFAEGRGGCGSREQVLTDQHLIDQSGGGRLARTNAEIELRLVQETDDANIALDIALLDGSSSNDD
jgi:hypothetical protein